MIKLYISTKHTNLNCTRTRGGKEEKEIAATTTFQEKQRTPALSTWRIKEKQLWTQQ